MLIGCLVLGSPGLATGRAGACVLEAKGVSGKAAFLGAGAGCGCDGLSFGAGSDLCGSFRELGGLLGTDAGAVPITDIPPRFEAPLGDRVATGLGGSALEGGPKPFSPIILLNLLIVCGMFELPLGRGAWLLSPAMLSCS